MASIPFRPDGHNAACPYLIVSDAAGTIAFLVRTFGATVLGRYPDEAGRLRHAEVRIDDSIVMLADATPEWPPMPSYVHIYVPDVDASYARALAAGAESVQEPVPKDDEDKCVVDRSEGAQRESTCRRALTGLRNGLRPDGGDQVEERLSFADIAMATCWPGAMACMTIIGPDPGAWTPNSPASTHPPSRRTTARHP